ncbi:carbohydrate ABC transporter permease [Pseudactinotalea sp. Z1748]|uniref:carbohydrate ABC transporter permease n=1 Tax=Pseudactinotalea sp. Z1748 TaxID=3413027 RepID=UPI003C7C842D
MLGVNEQATKIKDSRGYTVFRWFNAFFLILVCVLTLYPFVNVIAQAFSAEIYITRGQVNLFPRGFNVTTFEAVMGDSRFWTNYRNTVVYTVTATAISMVLTTTFAYAISKKHLKGRNIFIAIALFTMVFNGGLIPNYVLVDNLGMRNTMWAIVIPNAISAFNLLIMKSFFENFPADLEEAARIDGLHTYGVLWRIVLPLSKAVIATMILFYAVAFWNQWFFAFIYLDDANLYPVTMYLRNLMAGALSTEGLGTESAQINSNIQAVAMLLTMLPILCLYPFIQKYFVSGVMLGAVKQ